MVFKSWQVFVFSLIPLALVFIGVISGSFHGSDSDPEVFPTPPPAPSGSGPGPGGPGGPGAPGAAVLQLVTMNLMFDRRTLSAPANAPVTLRFDNRDPGVIHNFSIYDSNRLTTKIFIGDLTTGPSVTNYTFTAPAPGSYFYRCDVHPDTATGTFTAR